jgi:transcriptional regulator with GAF, ATPase, and Fis domain
MLTTCEEGMERHVDGLVAELSTELCHAAAADLDHVVETALGRIVETVCVDRTTLVQYDEGDRVPQTFCATAGVAGLGPHSVQGGATPWLLGDWTAKEDVQVYERVPEDLPAAARTPELLQQLRDAPVRSAVAINVAIGGHRTGALVIETMRDERHWSAALIERTRLLAEILTVALHRRRQEELAQRSRDEVVRLTAGSSTIRRRPNGGNRRRADVRTHHRRQRFAETSLARLKESPRPTAPCCCWAKPALARMFARAIHENGPRRPGRS